MGRPGVGKGKYKKGKDPKGGQQGQVQPDSTDTSGTAPKAGPGIVNAKAETAKPAEEPPHKEEKEKEPLKKRKIADDRKPSRDFFATITVTEDIALGLGVTLDLDPGKLIILMSNAIVFGAVAESLFAATNGLRADKVWVIPFVETLADVSAHAVSQALYMFKEQITKVSGVAGDIQVHPDVVSVIKERLSSIFISNVASGLLTRSIGKMQMKDGTLVYLAGMPIGPYLVDAVALDASGDTVPYGLTVAGAVLRHDILQVNQRFHAGNVPNLVLVTFFRCWLAQLPFHDAVTVTATCHYAVVDAGVRQLFEGLLRAYNMPLTPSQVAGLNRYNAEDAWARYVQVYDTAEGQNLCLWTIPSFRSYILDCMEHEPTSHGVRPSAIAKLAMTLDPANFVGKNVNEDNFRMVSDNSQSLLLRAEFPSDNKLTIQTI